MIRKHTRNPALVLGLSLALGAAGCSVAGSEDQVSAERAEIPASTAVVVSLNSQAHSDEILPGSILYGTVDEPVFVNGEAVVRAGQAVSLEVVEAQAAHDGEPALLTLDLQRIEYPGRSVEVASQPIELIGEPESMGDGEKVAAGAVGGAVVGGIVDGPKGAAIGGILGTMAGAVIAINTEGDAIVLPAGQKLRFRTTDEVEVPRA